MKIIVEKEKLFRFKVLTLISSFGLGVCALIGAYLLVEAIEPEQQVFKDFASGYGMLTFLGQMVHSGIIYAIGIYICAETMYKIRLLEEKEKENIQDSIKFTIGLIVKLLILFVVFVFLDIKIEDVDAIYCGIAVVSMLLASITYITKETVIGLNKKLNEKKANDLNNN